METYKSLLQKDAFGLLEDRIKKWLNGETIEERVFSVRFKGFKLKGGKVEAEFQTKRRARFPSGTLFCISPTGNFQDNVWATVVSERDTAVSERDKGVSKRDTTVSERDTTVSESDTTVLEGDIRVHIRGVHKRVPMTKSRCRGILVILVMHQIWLEKIKN